MRRFFLLHLLLAGIGCFDGQPSGSTLDGRIACASNDECGNGVCTDGRCLEPQRRAPRVLGPASLDVVEDQAASFNLTIDGDVATAIVELASAPQRGRVVIDGFTLTYTPDPNFFGTDALTIVVVDTAVVIGGQPVLRSAPHQVAVLVAGVPDPFTVEADTVTLPEDTSADLVFAIDDPEGGDCDVSITSPPSLGEIDATLRYHPRPDVFGVDEATALVTCVRGDGTEATQSVIVTIIIQPVDDEPVPLSAGPVEVDEDDFVPIALPFREVDGDQVCFTIIEGPAQGVLNVRELDEGLVVYAPDVDVFGTDTFTFAVGDPTAQGCTPTTARAVVFIEIAPQPDAARFTTDTIGVSVVGAAQFIALPLFSPDEATGETPRVELVGDEPVTTALGAFRAENGAQGPGLSFTPVANLTQTEGVIRLRTSHRGLVGPVTTLRVAVDGARSCATAKLLAPAAPSGLLLLSPVGGVPYVTHCEQHRRGGGFELLLKINGQTPAFRGRSPIWGDDRLLNPTNVALDGGDAKLVGATTLALDDVMIGVPTAGETPGAFAEVALPPSFAGRTLTNIMSFPGFVVPHWATLGWESIAGRSEGSTVGCSNPTATFELGINLRARIGGVAVFACPGFPPVEEVIGVGLETESASSGGGQIVLGRSRDFTTLPEAPSCAAHQARYGAAFLPGTYVVAGARELCGDLTVALPRGCGDGALDASAEQCDDGDSIDVNLCSNSCRLAECGDGVVQEPEECEPPNVNCVGIGPCSALCSKQCRSFDVIE